MLVLLALLSPVAVIVAALLLGMSVIALIIRVAKKGSIKNWGMVAVASVVLMFTFGWISDALYGIGFVGGDESVPSGQYGEGETGTDTPSSGEEEYSPGASPEASPAALSIGDEVTLTCEIHGYPESFDYEGLYVTGQVLDCDGVRILAVSDSMRGGGFSMEWPGEQVRVSGEYEGPISTSKWGSYEAVMVEEIESVAQ